MAEWNRDHGLGHVSLRPARRSDWSDLAKLARRTYSDAFRDSMESSALELHLERNLSDSRIGEMLASDTFLLAMAGKEIVGFVQYGAWKADPSFSGSFETAYPRPVEIRRLYVTKNHQNEGIGTRLLKTAIRRILQKDARAIFLSVWWNNAGAQRLYERFGFKKIGVKPYYGASEKSAGFDMILVLDVDAKTKFE